MASCSRAMQPVDKWRRLSPERRQALPRALAVVTLVRLCLRFLPLRVWERVANRLPSRRPPAGSAHVAARDVAWAVSRVSRAVPGATCLTQALAAQLLLSRRGYASRLRIGVARAPGDGLRAHAWLESDGLVVLGESGFEAFTPLSATMAEREDVTSRAGGALRSGSRSWS